MTIPDRLLTVHEAAEILGIHAVTLRSWVRRGRIAVVRIGTGKKRRLRFEVETIRRYIERHREGG